MILLKVQDAKTTLRLRFGVGEWHKILRMVENDLTCGIQCWLLCFFFFFFFP